MSHVSAYLSQGTTPHMGQTEQRASLKSTGHICESAIFVIMFNIDTDTSDERQRLGGRGDQWLNSFFKTLSHSTEPSTGVKDGLPSSGHFPQIHKFSRTSVWKIPGIRRNSNSSNKDFREKPDHFVKQSSQVQTKPEAGVLEASQMAPYTLHTIVH